jgi:serine/threonine-protein phosphatase 2A regulatory subunit B''
MPNPLFINNLRNSTTSQAGGNHFIPPVSPNAAGLQNFQYEKRNLLNESTSINQEKKKMTESSTNPLLTSKVRSNNIPQFYFPNNDNITETIEQENILIAQIFKKDSLNLDEFKKITEELYHFPDIYNRVLFQKIDKDNKGVIKKNDFISYHNKYFKGISNERRYFNLIKSENNNVIVPKDFKPFLDCLLDFNKSLEFLKEYPAYQVKYSDTAIFRIFYKNDLKDNGTITLREFKKSNIIETLITVSKEDINSVRDYFSYEHFYVLYCIFYELDPEREPESQSFISREAFSKYKGHALGEKVVDRIFKQIPRKFRSPNPDKMSFEDFSFYLLSEEDKTNPTSIKYWFTILDLDANGIVTPSEMAYFYEEQERRLESLQNEIILFNDVLCQIHDMIPPDKEYQWTLQNFLDHPKSASIAFNALFNLKKFQEYETFDPYNVTEIDKNPEYTDWEKFAYYEYKIKSSQDEEGNEDEISNGGDEDLSAEG